MEWFQPTAGTLIELSTTCIGVVFLIYLLRLKTKTNDCYLIIAIYSTFLISEATGFIIDSSSRTILSIAVIDMIFDGLQFMSIIWCSYRVYKNIHPRESLISIVIYSSLFFPAAYLWLHDYALFDGHISLMHILYIPAINATALLLATFNYFRKIKAFSTNKNSFSLFRELFHPSSREIALFGGFAFSLITYILIELLVMLLALQIIGGAVFFFLIYLLSVLIIITVFFSYFNYAREHTSFNAKLVGLTLIFMLSLISIIPLIVYRVKGKAESDLYTRIFVFIIPVSALLISLLLPLLFRITILKHLNKVVTGVQSVIAGDLNASVDVEVNDEIGRLSRNFNQMTSSLRQRTEELQSVRENIATDFHDQTGNMLSAINRQAGLLKLTLTNEHKAQPMVESIIINSENLYESSKDFLWHLNHHSDDPKALFDYLTGYGQFYYNQFDIAFSSSAQECRVMQFESSAAINLIYIFKEAMTNVVKHAGADDVCLIMSCGPESITMSLKDNGSWKEADHDREHYGLSNMERRCQKNNFQFSLIRTSDGTRVAITIPTRQA